MIKTYLKPESGVWFYLQYIVYLQWVWWEWEKKTEKYIYMKENKEIIHWSVALPSPVYKIGGRMFSGSKEPETSRTYPRWDGNPNLQW